MGIKVAEKPPFGAKMLLIMSEAARGTRALSDVVREMSFTVSHFATPTTFTELMGGQSRRIVMLAETDITKATVETLKAAVGRAPFAVIIAADNASIRSAETAEVVDAFLEFDNVAWIGPNYDYEKLAASARRCRRRMLKLSRQDIDNAFTDFEFVLRYQPKVERGKGGEWITTEVEALVRWRHPEHGLIGPLEFLPEIEAFGMNGRLTDFVLRKTAAQLKTWHEQGLVLRGCINLAPSLLNDTTLAAHFVEIVNEFGLAPNSFTFEVVEQDLSDPAAKHLVTLGFLREAGFRLCLDDFRVAASSLSTFEKLPFDEIKIHASALRRAKNDPISLKVLAAVTGLAHNLGMSVCAQGVEDQAIFEFLKTIECDKMQGFAISAAVMPNIIRHVYKAKLGEESAA
jgi:EAL domain-containing protein (putative c-di-GMP-specific phosphodiesterase class I)